MLEDGDWKRRGGNGYPKTPRERIAVYAREFSVKVTDPLIMIGFRSFLAAVCTLMAVSPKAEVVVPASSAGWTYHKGISEASSPDIGAWRQQGFSDASWSSGSAPFYYGESVAGGTQLNDMRGNY